MSFGRHGCCQRVSWPVPKECVFGPWPSTMPVLPNRHDHRIDEGARFRACGAGVARRVGQRARVGVLKPLRRIRDTKDAEADRWRRAARASQDGAAPFAFRRATLVVVPERRRQARNCIRATGATTGTAADRRITPGIEGCRQGVCGPGASHAQEGAKPVGNRQVRTRLRAVLHALRARPVSKTRTDRTRRSKPIIGEGGKTCGPPPSRFRGLAAMRG